MLVHLLPIHGMSPEISKKKRSWGPLWAKPCILGMGGCSLDALDESSQGVGWLEDQAEWVDDDTVDGRLSSVSILYGIYEDYMDYMISINNPYKYWWYYYPVIIPISKKCFIVTNSYLVGGDWNMNGLWLSTYWEFHHPNWLSYFSGVETTNQVWTGRFFIYPLAQHSYGKIIMFNIRRSFFIEATFHSYFQLLEVTIMIINW